jgi:hypothetical protein
MPAHRRLLIVLSSILLALVIAAGVAYVVLNAPNQATPEATAALQPDAAVAVSQPAGQDWYVFTPTTGEADTGLIIYPGGFVDPVAYAPLARAIAAQGFLVVLDPMPLNLAVTGINAADDVIAAFLEIGHWAVGGHSLGGAMAAEYTKNNADAVEGLALWAAYPAESTDLSYLPLIIVSIGGDADGLAAVADVMGAAERLPADARFVIIHGGNHTQFGSYGQGLQRGDNPATIGRDEQQAQIVDATVEMLQAIGSN